MTSTHSHVHHVRPGLGAGQHGGHTGSCRVVGVHVDGHVREAVPQGADQKLAGLGLQQAGHVLHTDGGKRRAEAEDHLKSRAQSTRKEPSKKYWPVIS